MILEVSIHAPGYGKKDLEYGDHSRIREVFTPLDVTGTLEAEFQARKGRFIVSGKGHPSILTGAGTDHCATLKVCADNVIADKARMHVQRRMDKEVRFIEMDFQPSLRETGRWSSSDMEFQCRG